MKLVNGKIICKKCNLEFEFDSEDIQHETEERLRYKNLIYVRCPICNDKLYINKKG